MRDLFDRLARLVFGIGFALALSVVAAVADDDPFVRIETGVHEAVVNRVARLADGRLITVSDDKTARLWSAAGLQAAGVLLPPIGADDTGALYAVAASTKAIAVGGRIRDATGLYAVVLYSQATLAAAGVLPGLPAAVTALSFSPDGTSLAIGLQNGEVRVFGITARRFLLQDAQYDKAVSWLTFDSRSRLIAVSEGGTLRIYEPDLARAANVALPRDARPYGVAVSSDGKHIALGDRQRAVVRLFDAERLRLERELPGGARRAGSFNVVAFSPDGHSVLAAGSYVDAAGVAYVRRWGVDGSGAVDIPVARDLITDLLPLADGIAVTTAEPSVVRLGRDDKLVVALRSRHLDFRTAGRGGLRLSADGARIRLPVGVSGDAGPLPSERAVVVDMRLREIVAAGGDAGLLPPYAAAAGLGVTEWQNSRTPRLNGQLIPLQDAETVRSVAVQPNGAAAVLGTDFFVRFIPVRGEPWRRPADAPAWAVNISADGRWVVAGLTDGTVHWYRAADGQPVLTLFIDPPSGRFVIWTAEGFFDHDHRTDGQPDGRSLIGYRFNLPAGRASDFVEIGQLYPRFFRPDLVGLAFRDDARARRILADQARLLGNVRVALAEGLPPAVTLLEVCTLGPGAPPTGCAGQAVVALRGSGVGDVAGSTLRLRYRLHDATGHVGTVAVSRNGALVRPQTVIESADDSTRVEQATLALGRGRTVLALMPVSNTGAVEASADDTVTLTLVRRSGARGDAATASAAAPQERVVPKLFVLSVGVNETGNPDWTLANPENDARAVADVMRAPVPTVYEDPDVQTLLDPESTGDGIMAGLRRIAERATPDDLVLIYLAGHGRTIDGRYYFAPHDLGAHDPAVLARVRDPNTTDAEYDAAQDVLFRTEGLAQEQLVSAIQTIPASRVALILDTCYSATVAEQDSVLRRDTNVTVTDRLGKASGRFILSGSFAQAWDATDDTDAASDSDGHGMFTSFLLRALRGEADTDKTGRVDIVKIARFTEAGVLQQSANRPHIQRPAYYFAGNDFFALH